jgi:murein DD-endopeptidase MepM/ murein hydrolase activator NlpD
MRKLAVKRNRVAIGGLRKASWLLVFVSLFAWGDMGSVPSSDVPQPVVVEDTGVVDLDVPLSEDVPKPSDVPSPDVVIESPKTAQDVPSSQSSAPQGPVQSSPIEDSIEDVACIRRGNLNVYSDDLQTRVNKIKALTPVKKFQDFGGESYVEKKVGRVQRKFVKIQLSDQSSGWVQERFILKRGVCEKWLGIDRKQESTRDVFAQGGYPQTRWDLANANPNYGKTAFEDGRGLTHAECCEFPLLDPPDNDFSQGNGSFGASRGDGRRKHAGNDLYKTEGAGFVAVADGIVLRGPYEFYLGTYAIEVRHQGGFIVRYGEISARLAEGVRKRSRIEKGQKLGAIKQVNSDCCDPMLHFELFSGMGKGKLSVKKGKFKRRWDLLNPTSYLSDWMTKP